MTPPATKNATPLTLPFNGEWTVGEHDGATSGSVLSRFQPYALHFSMAGPGRNAFRTTGAASEDYFCFGRQLFAPCDAEVMFAVDGVKDNAPGMPNPFFPLGNSVLLRTRQQEFVLLAHLKQFSLKVKQGQHISAGWLLGLCGNSGMSSAPHLYFHVQDAGPLETAGGLAVQFSRIVVDGALQINYSPRPGEHVRN